MKKTSTLSVQRWRRKNPQRAKQYASAYRSKNRVRIRRYMREWANKMRVGRRVTLLQAQGGKCAICGTTAPGKQGWMLDHCHGTNAVRGVLCCNCNWGLGHFKDSIKVLDKARRYLLHSI